MGEHHLYMKKSVERGLVLPATRRRKGLVPEKGAVDVPGPGVGHVIETEIVTQDVVQEREEGL